MIKVPTAQFNRMQQHLSAACVPTAIVGKDTFGILMDAEDHARLLYAVSDKRQRRKLRRIEKMKLRGR